MAALEHVRRAQRRIASLPDAETLVNYLWEKGGIEAEIGPSNQLRVSEHGTEDVEELLYELGIDAQRSQRELGLYYLQVA